MSTNSTLEIAVGDIFSLHVDATEFSLESEYAFVYDLVVSINKESVDVIEFVKLRSEETTATSFKHWTRIINSGKTIYDSQRWKRLL